MQRLALWVILILLAIIAASVEGPGLFPDQFLLGFPNPTPEVRRLVLEFRHACGKAGADVFAKERVKNQGEFIQWLETCLLAEMVIASLRNNARLVLQQELAKEGLIGPPPSPELIEETFQKLKKLTEKLVANVLNKPDENNSLAAIQEAFKKRGNQWKQYADVETDLQPTTTFQGKPTAGLKRLAAPLPRTSASTSHALLLPSTASILGEPMLKRSKTDASTVRVASPPSYSQVMAARELK